MDGNAGRRAGEISRQIAAGLPDDSAKRSIKIKDYDGEKQKSVKSRI